MRHSASLLLLLLAIQPLPGTAQGPALVAAINPADFASKVSTGAATHILVGQSMFIDTKQRLKRVYITNPAVIDSYTASPNEVLVTAKASGESSLVLWDESGASQAYMISSDIDVTRLRESLKQVMPEESIAVQGNAGRILLTGTVSTEANEKAALKLAELYSKDVSNALVRNSARAKQVQLKVRIVEVDRSKLDQFGFNFFSGGGNNIAQTTTTQFPSTPSVSGGGSGGGASNSNSAGGKTVSVTNPLNFFFYSSRLNIGATLQDMANRQVLEILAEPTLTTLSGQEANFLSGGEFPFPIVQGGVGGMTSVSIQFRPYGVKVQFLPQVNPDGTIQLKVAPEVSALDYTNAVTLSGYVVPALSTRKADTEVVVENGQTFAISGLLDRRTTDSFGRTPGIASVPVLGQLFKSKSLNRSTTELLVLVTPTIVDPMTQPPAEQPQMAIPMIDTKSFDNGLPPTEEKPKTKANP
ncbi:MAG TPA: pilus assembly protein N-terminal domain-containing protein [Granulicella sp.]